MVALSATVETVTRTRTDWTQVGVRLTPDEVRIVDRLAPERGVTRSAVVAKAVRRVLKAEANPRANQ